MVIDTKVRTGALAAAVVLAVTVAGCGSAPSPVRATATSGDLRARASADADALLRTFRPPPGATPSRGEPPGTPSELDQPSLVPNTPDLVTRTRWWTVPDAPAAVIAWATAHPPRGATSAGGTSQSQSGATVTELMTMFLAPSGPAGLTDRRLLVQVGPMAGGGTALRVDAQDTWVPPKPASEAIPPASVLTIRATPFLPHSRPPGGPTPSGSPVPTAPKVMTVSDRAVIAQAAKLVGALPVTGRGVMHCPADRGGSLDLTFASMGGTTLATVRASASGCGFVAVTVGGAAKPGLRGGPDLIRRLGALLHVRWPGMS